MIASDYIKELLTKFPESGDRTIANLAFKKQPKLFSSYDHCRSMVKYYRGHNGEKSRSLLGDNFILIFFNDSLLIAFFFLLILYLPY